MRVLLLEDETAIRSALARGLKRAGHRVQAADCLHQAREQARLEPPDFLLTDLKLPDGNGLELAAELGVACAVMSGYAAFDEAVQALRLGCVDFFTKPVSIQALRACLERQSGRRQGSGIQLVQPGPDPALLRLGQRGWELCPLECCSFSWYTPDAAAACYQAHPQAARSLTERRILAELLQAVPAGRVFINRAATWWRVGLEAADADALNGQEERRQVIESCATQVVWRADGVMVEVQQ